MIRNLWLETVISKPVTWADGRTLEPCTPFELTGPLRFGPRGSNAELIWPESHELRLSPGPGGVFFGDTRDGENPTAPLVKPGDAWRLPLTLRVLASPADTVGWPRSVARPNAPWTDEILSVLADQLLEKDLAVGQRFLTRDEQDDFKWLPRFRGLKEVSWRRGVVDELKATAPAGWEFGRALALQAVCVPMRQLKLTCEGTLDPSSVVTGLIEGGGLPCLQAFHFRVEVQRPNAQLETLPGFEAAFPSLRAVSVT